MDNHYRQLGINYYKLIILGINLGTKIFLSNMNFSKKIGFCKFNISTSQEFLFDILPDYEGQRNSTKGELPWGLIFCT